MFSSSPTPTSSKSGPGWLKPGPSTWETIRNHPHNLTTFVTHLRLLLASNQVSLVQASGSKKMEAMDCNGLTDLQMFKAQNHSITKVQNYFLASDSTQTPPAGPVHVRPVVGTSPVLSSDIHGDKMIQAELNETNVLNDVELLDCKDSIWDQKGEEKDEKQKWEMWSRKHLLKWTIYCKCEPGFWGFQTQHWTVEPTFRFSFTTCEGQKMLTNAESNLRATAFISVFCGSCQSAYPQWQGEHYLWAHLRIFRAGAWLLEQRPLQNPVLDSGLSLGRMAAGFKWSSYSETIIYIYIWSSHAAGKDVLNQDSGIFHSPFAGLRVYGLTIVGLFASFRYVSLLWK